MEGGLAQSSALWLLAGSPPVAGGQPGFTLPELRALWEAVCWHVQPDGSISTDGEVLTSPVI